MNRKARRVDSEVFNEIHRRVREGMVTNAAALWRELCDEFPDTAPSERTVRDIVKELSPPDASDPWSPSPDADPEEASLVLEAKVAYLEHGAGEWSITIHHAKWLIWLRKGWPDLNPYTAFLLAEEYRTRFENGAGTLDLDALLAFRPWQSKENYRRLMGAVNAGKVPPPPLLYMDTPKQRRDFAEEHQGQINAFFEGGGS